VDFDRRSGCEYPLAAASPPIWQLFERARSLGLAVQVSAQSWHGLAAREDDRYRLATTAEGGIWLLRTPHPEPVVALAGRRAAVDTSRQLAGRLRFRRRRTSRLRPELVADPDLVRGLDVGQAAYLYRGGVTFTQVKRLAAGPAAPGGAPARAHGGTAADGSDRTPEPAAAAAAAAAPALPDISGLLDEAFGSRP
jgi:hypothetical protein